MKMISRWLAALAVASMISQSALAQVDTVARQKAAQAQATATTAMTNAATADAKAVTADGKAVAAQSTANTALVNAATAQDTANYSNTSAGISSAGGALKLGAYKPAPVQIATANARTIVYIATNPLNGDTITLNGTVITFVTSGATGNQVNIGATPILTSAALQAFINASADVEIVKFRAYSNFRSVTLFAVTPGSAGNALTVAVSAPTRLIVDGATLKLGATDLLPTVTLSKTSSSGITGAVSVPPEGGAFRYTGPAIALGTGGYAAAYVPTPFSAQMTAEWNDDSPIQAVRLFGANSTFALYVDGKPVNDGVQFQTDSSGADYRLIIDWGGARKMRRYELVGINMPFAGLAVGPVDVVYPPNDGVPLFAAIADSYEQGIGSFQGSTPGGVMARVLGLRYWADGVGGSGWNTGGGDVPATRITNRMALLGQNVSVIGLMLGYNDAGGNMTTAAAAFDSAIAAIRAAPTLSKAKIIVFGPATPVGSTANLTLVKAMLQARAAAYGFDFVDVENWITTTTAGIYTDDDGVHPAAFFGGPYLGARRAAAVLPLISN